jgi:hypothetical protein
MGFDIKTGRIEIFIAPRFQVREHFIFGNTPKLQIRYYNFLLE